MTSEVKNLFVSFGTGMLLGTVFFIFYVELSPTMGGILFRPCESGKKVFMPRSLFNLMLTPLQQKYMWRPNFLIINWFFVAGTGGLVAMFLYWIGEYFYRFKKIYK